MAERIEKVLTAWAEHEQKQLYRQSSLSYADERYQWKLDKKADEAGRRDCWQIVSQVDPNMSTKRMKAFFAFANITRSTAPREHSRLDEFGYMFRKMPLEVQFLTLTSLFNDYEILHTLRIVEKDSHQWHHLTTFLEQLPARKEALSKIIANSWLVLTLAWKKRRRQLARSNA
jgi:hypothetical protein